jgi:hypothetical protein
MEIELEIEGVADRAVADAIRKMVRRLGRQLRRPGDLRIRVAASETRGTWDLGIQDASGWHLTSLIEPVDQLPDAIDRTLRERLARPTPAVTS